MQIIAMLTMLIDHIGYIFFRESLPGGMLGELLFQFTATDWCRGIYIHHQGPDTCGGFSGLR